MNNRNNTWHLLFYFSLTLLFFSSCMTASSNEIQIAELVPTNNEVKDWVSDGETVVCSNHGELAGLINGGADFFIERGVEKAVFQDYKSIHRDTYINLELFQVNNSDQAGKIYNDSYVERPTFVPDIGENVRMANSLIGVFFIDFYLDNFYARLTITEKTDQSKNEIIGFGSTIYNKINNKLPNRKK